MRAFRRNSEFLRKARRMELGDRAPRKNTGAAILFFSAPGVRWHENHKAAEAARLRPLCRAFEANSSARAHDALLGRAADAILHLKALT